MKTIEGHVRDLLREFGDQVPRDGAPALRLPGGQAAYDDSVAHLTELPPMTGRRPAAPGSRRPHRKLAPAAAAAAVLAVAVAATVIAAAAHPRHPVKPAAHAITVPGGVPPYYVALEYVPGTISSPKGAIEIAVVRSTTTGKALVTVRVPQTWRSFTNVTAAADDRTFVLAAVRPPTPGGIVPAPSATKFYRLMIDPAATNQADRARLTALPVREERSGVFIHAFALSPDGARLAVSWSGPERVGQVTPSGVQVIDLASGRIRTITGGVQGICWESDSRTLALTGWLHDVDHWQVRLLRTGPGSHGNGRVALRLRMPHTEGWRDSLAATPDGRTAIATKVYVNKNLTPTSIRLEEYDIATGKLRMVIDKRTVRLSMFNQLAWMNPSGQVLVEIYFAPHQVRGTGLSTDRVAAILIGHQYHRIPWPRRAITGAW